MVAKDLAAGRGERQGREVEAARGDLTGGRTDGWMDVYIICVCNYMKIYIYIYVYTYLCIYQLFVLL